jgi:hypothetical protein
VHKFLAFAYGKQGGKDAARIEYQLANLCLEGILSTGTGTEDKPYLVLHVEDEYDVLGDVPAVVEIEVVLKMELSGIKDWG